MSVLNEPGTTTIAAHLVRRFRELGADEGFGIVGDFALRLFAAIYVEGFPLLVTADEQGAAFAADAYARLRGFGVVGVTYGVGGLKVTNATAGAWAEQVPLLVVSGAPGVSEQKPGVLLHHKIKDFDTQHEVFADLTIAQAVLDNPLIAAAEIDRVLVAMLAEQRPGYIEVPRDMVGVAIRNVEGPLQRVLPRVDEARLTAAVSEVMGRLRLAETAVAMAGVMVWRRDLAESLKLFAERSGMPVASGALSKGVFDERHELALGIYQGAVSPAHIVERVEQAEVILSLGVLNTDLTTGAFTAELDDARLIECTDHDVTVGLRTYRDVPLHAFIPALAEAAGRGRLGIEGETPDADIGFTPKPGVALSVETIMKCVEAAIDDRHGLIIEPGECLFASVDLAAPAWSLSSAYYATMGYSVPAALGAGKADPTRRPVVLVGDGGFLMTGLEALHAAFHGVHPLIIVIDNEGYGTQRPMLDGPFNDIPQLKSELLPEAFGTGHGALCVTEDELDVALKRAVNADELVIIRALVPKGVPSAALTRLTDALGKRI
ncbi:MAG: thiamine pyrophosphate-binding protein [Actinobacteria bacterium]|nr:thiamine pyrophosphate-binding protein [Actinomycetota bacterium]